MTFFFFFTVLTSLPYFWGNISLILGGQMPFFFPLVLKMQISEWLGQVLKSQTLAVLSWVTHTGHSTAFVPLVSLLFQGPLCCLVFSAWYSTLFLILFWQPLTSFFFLLVPSWFAFYCLSLSTLSGRRNIWLVTRINICLGIYTYWVLLAFSRTWILFPSFPSILC